MISPKWLGTRVIGVSWISRSAFACSSRSPSMTSTSPGSAVAWSSRTSKPARRAAATAPGTSPASPRVTSSATAGPKPGGSSFARPKSRRPITVPGMTSRFPGWGSPWKNPCSKIMRA